jgi:hypothetical protein
VSEAPEQQQPPRPAYEPPRIEDIPAREGPAVTAAGDQNDDQLVLVV